MVPQSAEYINLIMIWLMKLKYKCQMLSTMLTDNSNTCGLVGLCSFLSILLIDDTYKFFVLLIEF